MGKVRFVPMEKEHVAYIKVQEAQAHLGALIDEKSILIYPGLSWTGIVGGDILGCAGVYPIWPGRAFVWAFLCGNFGQYHFLQTHRFVLHVLGALQKRPEFQRIECTVRESHKAGHDWMRLLGFTLETPYGMLSYSPDGEKFYLYSRVA